MAEEEGRKLREEVTALRIERASPSFPRAAAARKREVGLGDGDAESVVTAESEFAIGVNGGSAAASSATLVEQLKHENAELRRDLGAQTSMLASRHRERERLQQEIEGLKLLPR